VDRNDSKLQKAFSGFTLSEGLYLRISQMVKGRPHMPIEERKYVRVTRHLCNTAVDPAKAGSRMSYRGKTYYFCCEGCLGNFMKDPGRYSEGA
jgi:YHS domain-containing protein